MDEHGIVVAVVAKKVGRCRAIFVQELLCLVTGKSTQHTVEEIWMTKYLEHGLG